MEENVEHKIVFTLMNGEQLKHVVITEGPDNPASGIDEFIENYPTLYISSSELVNEWPSGLEDLPLYVDSISEVE